MMTSSTAPILYVDDDRANLASFQYLLADRFAILTASHSDEALRILASERTAVLLADQRMESGMSGVELCALAHQRFPEVVRLLVTAYADVPTLQGGINEGRISAYIAKPWNEGEMVAKLNAAVDTHHRDVVSRDLRMGLLTWDHLSVSSFVVGHVLRDLCNPAAALRDNLDFGVRTLPLLEAGLDPTSSSARRRFRDLTQALGDASSAAELLVGRMAHLRHAEASAFVPQGASLLGPVVAVTAAVMGDEVGKRATFTSRLDEDARVAVEPLRLGRILAGLLVDALKSVAPGAPANNHVSVSTFVAGRHAGVTVETAGPDVQPSPLSGPFDPFPTAVAARGRALALAVIRDLIEAARGEMAIHGAGQGTLLRVRFPLATEDPTT